jgi:hypothetical protein
MGKAFILWLLAAIKVDILTHSTKAELEQAEAEREAQSVQGQHKQIAKVAAFLPNAIGRLKALLGGLGNVTQLQVDKACGLLRVMLGNAIVLHPMADGARLFSLGNELAVGLVAEFLIFGVVVKSKQVSG